MRTKRGVATEAGKVLYRHHAQLILRQCDQAQVDMDAAGRGLSGAVAVGLAPGTAAAGLALPLLRTVRARHPGVLLYLNETYGSTLSGLVMNGRMDLAVLWRRVRCTACSSCRCWKEPLYVVGPPTSRRRPSQMPLRCWANGPLLARPYSVVRKMVDVRPSPASASRRAWWPRSNRPAR